MTIYILPGLILGLMVGWSLHSIEDGTLAAAWRLTQIAGYFSILTALALRLIKMIIAPLVFSTLVIGIVHMGNTDSIGHVGLPNAPAR